VTHGTNRVVGVEPDAIYAAWRDVAEGRWSQGALPALWDGQAAHRLAQILLASGTPPGLRSACSFPTDKRD
jgi:UDP-N-acetylglucosamine 2-epimerase (non-hydrolysing)